MKKHREILRTQRGRLLAKQNVVGVGIGVKEKGGRKTGLTVLTVLVKRKLPEAELMEAHRVPKEIGGVRTDVIEVGELTLLALRTDRHRPAPAGVSVGHYKITAGTLGAVVRDRATGARLILSNNHVLANMTDGRDGRAARGDAVLQPGRYDGGRLRDGIGKLERFVPLHRRVEVQSAGCRYFKKSRRVVNSLIRLVSGGYELRLVRVRRRENLVDAAVARPLSDSDLDPDVLDLGPVAGVRKAHVGMPVVKSGRTSGVTRGEVRVIDATVRVGLGDLGYGMFTDQIVTTPMGQPGDSGSLVLTEDRRVVGLLSAGSESVTICSGIQNVMALLEIEFPAE